MMNSHIAGSDQPTVTVALMVQTGHDKPRFVLVDRDGFSIGSGDQCDLQLAEIGLPRWHSTLHVQGPAVWIEAADDAALITIDGEAYRRRALRDGDQLSFGATRIAVSIGDASATQPGTRGQRRTDDFTLLSANDLCDRIEQEESAVSDFQRRRRFGWQALLSALQEAKASGAAYTEDPALRMSETSGFAGQKLDQLVTQVRDLSATLEERSKAMSSQESLIMESSAQLAEAQLRVSRQLEQLLDRLADDQDQPGELRVSA